MLRDARPSVEPDLLESRNVLLAGTSVTTGEAQALVLATGMHTAFGKIAHLTQTTADPPSPLQNEIAALSRVIAALAVTIGLVVFVIGRFIGLSTSVSIVFAIGIIVANVPEGLLPTVTLAMALAARRMGKRHTLVRHLPSVETLGCASVICTDKTGTLTLNRMEIRSIYVDGGFVDPRAAETASFAGGHRRLFECAACCHDLKYADIGIAMGISGTDVAREASDLVLLDDNFASIVNAVEEGRTVFENNGKFLTYILTSNVPELVPYLAFAFARVPLALTVIQILAVELGTDMVPALGLAPSHPIRE